MVFSSYLFLFWFLPVVLLCHHVCPKRFRNGLLTVASYVFYGWEQPVYCWLMLVSSLIDYGAGLALAERDLDGKDVALDPAGPRTKRQKLILWGAIAANLGLLGYFKYGGLLLETFQGVLVNFDAHSVIDDAQRLRWQIPLPLGISFYTFQSMSYTIDVYRGEVKASRKLIDFLCYVSLFPQLVAGPIVRYGDVASELGSRTIRSATFARGAACFILGLGKKILLANPCGQIADWSFDHAPVLPTDAWGGLVAYAWQIYFDFSGYSDMAIGLGLMLGFSFPENFNSPYLAASLGDFWRRWHITLSTWLRDNLYVPLGGNRRGTARTYFNLIVVMFLGGLWHGANWTFAIWGLYHGVGLACERLMTRIPLTFFRPLRMAATLTFVLIGWVSFRSKNLVLAGDYLSSLVGLAEQRPGAALLHSVMWNPVALAMFVVSTAIVFWGTPVAVWTTRLTPLKVTLLMLILVLSLGMLAMQEYNPFIYFIF